MSGYRRRRRGMCVRIALFRSLVRFLGVICGDTPSNLGGGQGGRHVSSRLALVSGDEIKDTTIPYNPVCADRFLSQISTAKPLHGWRYLNGFAHVEPETIRFLLIYRAHIRRPSGASARRHCELSTACFELKECHPRLRGHQRRSLRPQSRLRADKRSPQVSPSQPRT